MDTSLLSTFDPWKIFDTKQEVYQFFLVIIILSTSVLDANILHYSLKSYEGDIYFNHMILLVSGSLAIYLSYFLINNFHPALSLSFAFTIMCTAGFLYPPIHNMRGFMAESFLVDINTCTMFLLSMAKLG